jgi:hypothetical protein
MNIARSTRVALFCLCAQTTLASFAIPARADAPPAVSDADAERARSLKQRGDEAMDALRYGDALAAYQQAYEITKSPALLYNQARAYQALGDFANAADMLDRFAKEAPPDLKQRVPKLNELIDEVHARVAKLTVRCNVKGAQVVLGQRVLGTTPLPAELRTSSGRATLTITAEGYQPFTRDVVLPGGGALTVDAQLVSKDASATLVVRANVPAAAVVVDDKPEGQTPIELSLRAGAHSLRVDHEGYEPVRTQVVLRVGERKELDLELTKPSPVYAKWWFWTAVGVVAVSATVTVIALTTEKSPDSGSVTPGRLSAPLVRW